MQGKRRFRRLNQRLILEEAVHLLNEGGLENLSLRKLAERLGVSAPSLYRHFRDKAALLSVLLDSLFFEVLFSIPAHRDPAEWMNAFGEAIWRKMMEVRDYGRLVLVTEVSGDQVARTVAVVQSRVAHLDMPGEEALNLQSSIQALLIGWAAFVHSPFGSSLREFVPIEELALRDMRRLITTYCD